jgi:dihydropyrimidinase
MKTLIQSGSVITPQKVFQADILIEGERIAAIEEHIQASDARVIDAAGKYALPGGVDPHTHFDLPMFDTVSSDDHYTGHKAAAIGGTTTVMDFVPQQPGLPLEESVALWREKAEKAAIDYSFHMNITHFDDDVALQIPRLLDLGIPTLKVFMAYNGRLRLSDEHILHVMEIARRNDMLTLLHAEDGDQIESLVEAALAEGSTAPLWHARTRPAEGAVAAVRRGIDLAKRSGGALYVVHMNAGGEADALAEARGLGLPVMGETCPHYLFFTAAELEREDGAKWVCSPPMRSEADNARLWEALGKAEIQVMGTDHCPFFYDGNTAIEYEGGAVAIPGKELGANDFTRIPNGLPGVGDRLPILWTEGVVNGRISPQQFVALTSENPARIFGLYPRKGALLPGSDADIVIWDPDRELVYGEKHAAHRTDYNLYEGWPLKGFPEKVFLRGRLIVDREEWLGQRGGGQFLKRVSHAEIV